MDYNKDELRESVECLMRADEIQNDKALMKELEPYMIEQNVRMDKLLSLKELWDAGKKRAAEDDNNEEMKDKLSNEEPEKKIKNTKNLGEDPLAKEKLNVGKSGQS